MLDTLERYRSPVFFAHHYLGPKEYRCAFSGADTVLDRIHHPHIAIQLKDVAFARDWS